MVLSGMHFKLAVFYTLEQEIPILVVFHHGEIEALAAGNSFREWYGQNVLVKW